MADPRWTPKIGDRVRVKGRPHMPGQRAGEVAVVEGNAIGVRFDGSEGIHRWYTPNELEPEMHDDMRGDRPKRGMALLLGMPGGGEDSDEMDLAEETKRAAARAAFDAVKNDDPETFQTELERFVRACSGESYDEEESE